MKRARPEKTARAIATPVVQMYVEGGIKRLSNPGEGLVFQVDQCKPAVQCYDQHVLVADCKAADLFLHSPFFVPAAIHIESVQSISVNVSPVEGLAFGIPNR